MEDNSSSPLILLGKVLLYALVSFLAMLALVYFYSEGSELARELGRRQRGGVGWGITVFYTSFCMLPASFVTQWLYAKYPSRLLRSTAIGVGLFFVLSTALMGNQFSGGGWSYPYRYLYFEFCGVVVLTLLMFAHLLCRRVKSK
ncbi:hypothetical protein [Vibrio sonorensis]|uniref:hypothetical protein n=1 Tax=Vibrio sonorensis TaxID=1004316 RepID=UPI0008D9C8F8|nr:hypothetical protein [Vibrio sonorensis]